MKKIFIMLLSLFSFLSLIIPNRVNAQTAPKVSTTTAKAVTMTGTVSADEKSIVSDKDKKTWAVKNPDTLKGHAAQHLGITAQVDTSKSEITVKSIKVLTAKAQNTSETPANNDDRLRVPPNPVPANATK